MAGALFLCAVLMPLAQTAGRVPSCQDVRSYFQLLHPGLKGAPESPVSGTELQACLPRGPTCCSRKMEERYQIAARQNLESSLQSSSAKLKLLIIQNAALFQEAFEMVLRHGRNATLRMLREEFPGLKGGAHGAVGQLFLDVLFYILGSDSTVDSLVSSFFARLFPLVYRRLLGGGGQASEECLHGAWRGAGAFGAHAEQMSARLSRALLSARVFLQALNLGIEVANTTDHLRPGRECGRALLRLHYCPHCLGLLGAPPCPGHCASVVQGCLGGAAEVQPHWLGYVEGLGALVGSMHRDGDVEAVVMRLDSILHLAIRHALTDRSRITAVVSSVCSHPSQRVSRSAATPVGSFSPITKTRTPNPLPFDPEQTLAGRRREFISSLKAFSTFFSGLGQASCDREPVVLNSSLCWNGLEMTDRISAAGSKRIQPPGSESKVKAPEPVISQVIDKLKHVNQLLRLVTAPGRRWRARPAGGAWEQGGGTRAEEEDPGSGDCDDEDECGGVSGLGPPPHHRRLRIFADLADNFAMDDFTLHKRLLTPLDVEGEASATDAARSQLDPGTTLPGATALLTITVLLGLN